MTTKEYLDAAEADIRNQRDEFVAKVNHCNGALEFIAMARKQLPDTQPVPEAEGKLE